MGIDRPFLQEATLLRTFPILLLAPWLLFAPLLASATTYKCVKDGRTTYSQESCGAEAEKLEAKDALSGVNQPTPVNTEPRADVPAQRPSETASAPAATHTSETGNANPGQGDCAARLQAYHDSQACFGHYRINATVMDPEAYKHCTSVPEPTDCLSGGQ
jgi:hypothetical protein